MISFRRENIETEKLPTFDGGLTWVRARFGALLGNAGFWGSGVDPANKILGSVDNLATW